MTIEVDPRLLRAAATRTDELRVSLEQALRGLSSGLAGWGEPWGADKLGNRFADGPDGYRASRTTLTQSLEVMATNLGIFAAGQVQAAEQLETQEQANTNGFR